MQIELPAELERYLDDSIANGEFASRDELLADALRLHQERAERLRTLRAEIQKGIDSIERGEAYVIRSEEEHQKFWDDLRRDVLAGRNEGVST